MTRTDCVVRYYTRLASVVQPSKAKLLKMARDVITHFNGLSNHIKCENHSVIVFASDKNPERDLLMAIPWYLEIWFTPIYE